VRMKWRGTDKDEMNEMKLENKSANVARTKFQKVASKHFYYIQICHSDSSKISKPICYQMTVS
jgi:hypothetical protein